MWSRNPQHQCPRRIRHYNSHLIRGQQVYVEGRLQTRGWEDDGGKKHFRTELVANEMILLGDRRSHHHADLDFDEDDVPGGNDYAF